MTKRAAAKKGPSLPTLPAPRARSERKADWLAHDLLRRIVIGRLEPGSLLLMRGRSQLCWEHAIPKEKRPIGPRISVALRKASD